jgi:hypothetical protein
MANTRISQLTGLAGADAAANDVLPIVDTSAAANRKISVSALREAVGVDAAVAAHEADLAASSGSSLVGSDDGDGGSRWTTVAGFISMLMSSAGSSIVGFIQAGIGAVARTVQDKLRDAISSNDFGVVGDGVEDDTVGIQAAINAAALARKKLIIHGTPLCSSQITVPAYSCIEFDGSPGNQSGQLPASYLVKDATLDTALLLVSGESVLIRNGGVIGQSGNAGDNVHITGHSFRWEHGFSKGAGRDGMRIGKDGSGTPNANKFLLHGCTSYANGRDGFRIEDNLTVAGAPNSNAGKLDGCFAGNNVGHGCYGGNSFGNTISGCLFQSNGQKGLYLNNMAMGWTLVGGDYEANTGGSGATGADIWLEDTDFSCTLQDAGDTITRSTHGIVDGTPVKFSRIRSTTGISENTNYYVVNATADTFQVALTSGGAPIALTTDGSGIFFKTATHATRGGHNIVGVHVGRVPYIGAYQTDSQWILGQGFGSDSGLRPGYTEYTFTPTLEGSTAVGSVTLSSAVGRAIKVGRMVTVFFNVTVSSYADATGTLRIGGLPFKAASGLPSSFSPGLVSYLTLPGSNTVLGMAMNGWYADLYAYGATSTTAFAAVNAASQSGNFTTAGRISGSFTYLSYD